MSALTHILWITLGIMAVLTGHTLEPTLSSQEHGDPTATSHKFMAPSLNLANKKYTTLPIDQIAQYPYLTTLNLSNNAFADHLVFCYDQLKHLETLILSGNKITKLDLSHLPMLTLLDVSTNNLTTFSEMTELMNLKTLIVRNNKLSGLPDWVAHSKTLEYLDASDNNLTTLPAGPWRSCTTLLLRKNQLGGFFQKFDTLSFEQLRLWVHTFHNLKVLNISENKIKAFPTAFLNLAFVSTGLEALDLSQNTIPAILKNQPLPASLQRLSLNNLPLQTLVGLEALTRLTALDVSGNQGALQIALKPGSPKGQALLPPSLRALTFNDDTSTLPQWITQATHLRKLDLTRFTGDQALLQNLENLTHLQELRLNTHQGQAIQQSLKLIDAAAAPLSPLSTQDSTTKAPTLKISIQGSTTLLPLTASACQKISKVADPSPLLPVPSPTSQPEASGWSGVVAVVGVVAALSAGLWYYSSKRRKARKLHRQQARQKRQMSEVQRSSSAIIPLPSPAFRYQG